jgi:CopG family nickel-responsive transcriptional regulator
MPDLVRFGVSLRRDLLREFDRHIRRKKYPTRSKAIEGLISEALAGTAAAQGASVIAGTITMVYDHHKRDLVNRLLDLQHAYQKLIVSTQHVHLTHDRCLEMIVVKGRPDHIQALKDGIASSKGVFHSALTVAGAVPAEHNHHA